MITSEHSANSSFPTSRSKPFCLGNREQGGGRVKTMKNRLFRYKALQTRHLRRLSLFLGGFFRYNRLPARYLHQTAPHGPCMVLACLSGCVPKVENVVASTAVNKGEMRVQTPCLAANRIGMDCPMWCRGGTGAGIRNHPGVRGFARRAQRK